MTLDIATHLLLVALLDELADALKRRDGLTPPCRSSTTSAPSPVPISPTGSPTSSSSSG